MNTKDLSVLMLSGDARALDAASGVYRRLLLQAGLLGALTVFAWGKDGSLRLGERGAVQGFGGSKVTAARRMLQAGRAVRADVVTAQDPFLLGLIAWRIARRCGARLQLQVHTDFLAPAYRAYSLKNRMQYHLAKFLLRRADCIRVVTAVLAEKIRRISPRTPIAVLPVFTDIEAVREAPAAGLKKEYPQFSHTLLVAARLEPEKHVERIIRAMPAVVAALPHAGLFVAGDGSSAAALLQQARSLHMDSHVVFLGYRNDVYGLYKGADVVVAAAAPFEGYGAAVIEALAAGAPVVSMDVGIAREAGAVISAPEGLAQTVISVLKSGARGRLRLSMPDEAGYAAQAAETFAACGRFHTA